MANATAPWFGVSYFGNRFPHHAREDMRAMKEAGADFVVLVMSESDLRWNPGTMSELVAIARECGPGAVADCLGNWGRLWGRDGELRHRRSPRRPASATITASMCRRSAPGKRRFAR